jgi:hypothetical protein
MEGVSWLSIPVTTMVGGQEMPAAELHAALARVEQQPITVAIVTQNGAQERAVRSIAGSTDEVFLHAGGPVEALGQIHSVGLSCGLFLERETLSQIWSMTIVGNCADESSFVEAVKGESTSAAKRLDRPGYVAAAAVGTAGRIRGGGGAGVGAAIDVGLTWALQSHVEFAVGPHDPPDEIAEGVHPIARLSVELGLAFPAKRVVVGPAIAVDTTFLPEAEWPCSRGDLFCDGGDRRDRAVTVGVLFTRGIRHDDGAYLTGFFGLGDSSSRVDPDAPLLRARLEWGRPKGLFYGAAITGPYDLTVVGGLRL